MTLPSFAKQDIGLSPGECIVIETQTSFGNTTVEVEFRVPIYGYLSLYLSAPKQLPGLHMYGRKRAWQVSARYLLKFATVKILPALQALPF